VKQGKICIKGILTCVELVDHRMKKLRIFIAFANEKLRIAMLLLLDHEPGMVVVGITDRLPGLVTQLDASQPDVLLLEWTLNFQSTADLITDIHKLNSPPKIFLLSNIPEEREAVLAAGVDHFVVTNAPPDDLLLTLNKIRLTQTQKILPTLGI
jgi:DNA-binding NarL/FixJ family response regulator